MNIGHYGHHALTDAEMLDKRCRDLDVLGELDSKYLNVKHAKLQNSVAYNSVTMMTPITTILL
jgi:hypothetical protein